jgi:hypothetical protein
VDAADIDADIDAVARGGVDSDAASASESASDSDTSSVVDSESFASEYMTHRRAGKRERLAAACACVVSIPSLVGA